MSSTIFFFLFIPLLAFILLCVNLIFAPHNPYMEKDSAFECGFSSFLGQNRTQFSISFFIFALLFLLFDLEILLVYPYLVSAYTNGIYGLTVLLLFLLALTLGFAFELGKKALSIDSRQISNASAKKSDNVSKLTSQTSLSLTSKRYYGTDKGYYYIGKRGRSRHYGSINLPLRSVTNGYMAAVCGLYTQPFRPVESVDTVDTMRTLYHVSHLPSVPTHKPGSHMPSVPTHEPNLHTSPIGETSLPASSSGISTSNADLLALSKEQAVKYDLLKNKLLESKKVGNEVESTDLGKSSNFESDLPTSGLENYISYLRDSSEKYLFFFNDFFSSNQSSMLAIITLSSLIVIFTFLFKLIKSIAKFVKVMFKNISKTISISIRKMNKKTNISLYKTLIRIYIIIVHISKVLSSPDSDNKRQEHPEITWADPLTVNNAQSNQEQFSQVRWAANAGVSQSQDMAFETNTGQTMHKQHITGKVPNYTIATSDTRISAAQTNADPFITGSIE